MLMRVDPQRLNMNRGRDGKGFTQRFLLILQVGDMLEVVGIHIATGQQFIGVDPAGQLHHLEIETGIDFFDVVEDLRVGNRVRGDAQRGGLGRRPCQRKRQCDPCQFKSGIFHGVFLFSYG